MASKQDYTDSQNLYRKMVRQLLGSPEGKILVDAWKDEYCKRSYTRGDAHETAYNEGARSVIEDLIDILEERL